MPNLFEFPELQSERDAIMMFRTPFPDWNDDHIARWADMFGVQGRAQDAGSRFVVRDERGVLEVSRSSNSLWWTNLTLTAEEPDGPVDLPGEDEAVERAYAFLRERDLIDDRARMTSVTYTQLSRWEEGHAEGESVPIALHVNFEYGLDDLPVLGPGAKMQVTLGREGEVQEAYRFWREPEPDQMIDVVAPEFAARMLRRDEAFADLVEGEARVAIRGARLGYYALPPREAQGYLAPVYAFVGRVTTRQLERYDFVKHVPAVRISRADAKQMGVIFGEMPDVF